MWPGDGSTTSQMPLVKWIYHKKLYIFPFAGFYKFASDVTLNKILKASEHNWNHSFTKPYALPCIAIFLTVSNIDNCKFKCVKIQCDLKSMLCYVMLKSNLI